MGSYTQIMYQLIWSTKYRKPVMLKENRPHLFKYMTGILKNKKCHLYQINGVEDHLHILTHLHPSLALSKLVQDIKVASSVWIKEGRIFPEFTAWQIGYGAFTYAYRDKHKLINYIRNQEAHHKKETFQEEYLRLLKEHDIEFREEYLWL